MQGVGAPFRAFSKLDCKVTPTPILLRAASSAPEAHGGSILYPAALRYSSDYFVAEARLAELTEPDLPRCKLAGSRYKSKSSDASLQARTSRAAPAAGLLQTQSCLQLLHWCMLPRQTADGCRATTKVPHAIQISEASDVAGCQFGPVAQYLKN